MNISDINKELENILNEAQLNESPITLAKSGQPLFGEPKDMDTIVDECLKIYNNNPNSKGYAELLDKKLECKLPFNNQNINKSIVIVYGTELLGVRHILSRHGMEFESSGGMGQTISQGDVVKALRELPAALDNPKPLISFDLQGTTKKVNRKISKNQLPLPQTDRIILEYSINSIIYYYVILIDGLDGKSDVTCPITVFKPTEEYQKRIKTLNSVYHLTK